MSNENSLKSEFNDFIKDLVNDILKSVLYDDFKSLQNKYNISNENLNKISRDIAYSEKNLKSTINTILSSVKQIDEASSFLNQNIEKLTDQIEIKVRERLEDFLVENKKNMQNLSNEVQSMKTELIKANKLNQERTDKRIEDTEMYLQSMNNHIIQTTNNSQRNLENQIYALKDFTKKMSIGIISLGVLNIVLVIYIICSSLGVI
ncbi:MAG: hypothetical protein MR593_01795 [Intestinibacter sp.]|uniref:hypothetical protein n=1 Tax=Intestinibacter sp. TaxID=1965304 RepID=UPI0025B9C6B1|nr:hypothetical protein [Intestinibacter sp.]MCI6736843.1 hypothetical protein [Intestinibacter sp.]